VAASYAGSAFDSYVDRTFIGGVYNLNIGGGSTAIGSGSVEGLQLTVNSLASTTGIYSITLNGWNTSTFATVPTVTVTAPSSSMPGTNNPPQQATFTITGNGTPITTTFFVQSVNVTSPGSGYTSAPTVTISGGNNPSPGATATATVGPV
jgi:hypothetical protein